MNIKAISLGPFEFFIGNAYVGFCIMRPSIGNLWKLAIFLPFFGFSVDIPILKQDEIPLPLFYGVVVSPYSIALSMTTHIPMPWMKVVDDDKLLKEVNEEDFKIDDDDPDGLSLGLTVRQSSMCSLWQTMIPSDKRKTEIYRYVIAVMSSGEKPYKKLEKMTSFDLNPYEDVPSRDDVIEMARQKLRGEEQL